MKMRENQRMVRCNDRGRESREKREKKKTDGTGGTEVMEWIQTRKQTNTRAKVGQLHNV